MTSQQWSDGPVVLPYQPPPRERRSSWLPVVVLVWVAVLALTGWIVVTTLHTPSHPAPVAAPVAAPAPALTVAYRSSAGRFIARFAHRPVERPFTLAANGLQARGIDVIDNSARELLATFMTQPAIPASHVMDFLDGNFDSIVAKGRLITKVDTIFRDHRAVAGEFIDVGRSMSLIVFAYSPSRMYMIMAPSGAEFTALERSFRALP